MNIGGAALTTVGSITSTREISNSTLRTLSNEKWNRHSNN